MGLGVADEPFDAGVVPFDAGVVPFDIGVVPFEIGVVPFNIGVLFDAGMPFDICVPFDAGVPFAVPFAFVSGRDGATTIDGDDAAASPGRVPSSRLFTWRAYAIAASTAVANQPKMTLSGDELLSYAATYGRAMSGALAIRVTPA